jgi:hypothetical protein
MPLKTVCIFALILPLLYASVSLADDKAEPGARRFLPLPPQALTLCGEPVPLHDPFIAEQLDIEFNLLVHDQAQMVMCLKRAGRYFPYISQQLKAAGLPDDLKFLAVAESYLRPYVRSPAKALGIWQFMPATGARFKLAINDAIDERMNPERSTQAAIAYFKYLHKMFGNWGLAMAAYNCGEGKIQAELKEQGAKSYYDLYLPRETMRYVFRVMALKIILSSPETYGYYLPPEHIYKPHNGDRVAINLEKALPLRELALYCKIGVRQLRELNPEFNSNTLPKGVYQILVPRGQGKNVLAQLKPGDAPASAKPESGGNAGKTVWRVKTGETLSALSRQFGVSVQAIKRANNLVSDIIRPGQNLIIPSE